MIAHRLSTVRRADRIYDLEDGQVMEVGIHEELLARGGRYAYLYEMQFKAQEEGERDVVAPCEAVDKGHGDQESVAGDDFGEQDAPGSDDDG